jgi:hypothetical protein
MQECLRLADRGELVMAGDDPRVFDVRKWRVAVLERPHVNAERIMKTAEGTSVVRGRTKTSTVRKNAKRLTSAFLEPVRNGRANKGKEGEGWPIKGSDHAYLPVNYPNRIAAVGRSGRRAYRRGKVSYKYEGKRGTQ